MGTKRSNTRFGSLCENLFAQMTCAATLDTVELRIDPRRAMLDA